MDAIVRDEAVQPGETPGAAHFSIAGRASNPHRIEFDDVARQVSKVPPKFEPIASSSAKPTLHRGSDAIRNLRFLARKLATIGIAVLAVLAALMSWDLYNAAPWTRDGRRASSSC